MAARVRGVAVGLVAAVAAGCGSSGPPPGSLRLHPCRFGAIAARCGTLRVAEDPRRPNGRRIPLAVAVVPARGPDRAPDPLFYLAGWGSAAIQDDLADVVPAFAGVNRRRDLVFVDQRGTGHSNRLVCPTPPGPGDAAVAARTVTAFARRCARRIGPNLRYYTTAVAVDDFDAVRRALGYGTINVYGGSYGGTTGQAYLLRHGSHVRSMVLDGASLLDVRIFERGAPNAQRALDLLFARCLADAACHRAFGDPRADYRRLAARVRRAPLWIAGSDRPFGALALALALDDMVAYTPGKRIVPLVLHLAAHGRIGEAGSVLAPGQGAGEGAALAYQLLIQCSEPWASRRPAQVARLSAGTFLAPLERREVTQIGAACRGFPHGLVPADLGRRVRSGVPVLFLTGAEDPADPPANVAGARRELPNARVVVFPAAGHGQLRLECAQRLIAAVVERGSTRDLDVSCARTAALQPFDTSTG